MQPGVRALVKGQAIREYTYAYAAVEPKTGRVVSLYLPFANSECMQIFLKEVERSYGHKKVVIFMDQAAWHKAKSLSIPENIRLTFLPPYSPELNPVEMIWKVLRARFFDNVFFQSMDAVESRLFDALCYLSSIPNEVQSITLFSWMTRLLS